MARRPESRFFSWWFSVSSLALTSRTILELPLRSSYGPASCTWQPRSLGRYAGLSRRAFGPEANLGDIYSSGGLIMPANIGVQRMSLRATADAESLGVEAT